MIKAMSWAHWAAILGAWTVLSLFFAPELYLYFALRDEPIRWREALTLTAANTLIAAAFAPFIVWLTRRFPFGKETWKRSLAVHVPACLAFSIGHSSLYAALCFASPMFHVLFTRFHPNLLTYWAIVGFTEAFRFFSNLKERDQQLAQAQLQLLRAQLQPHFLFNTLHTVSAMIQEDPKGADRMISRLSDLLRLTLDNIGVHQTPLRHELEFIEKYIEIQRIRFQEKLTLELDVEHETLDCLAPSMILQPLVENSIRHGFEGGMRPGTIRIGAFRREQRLVLECRDNGGGFAESKPVAVEQGLGLASVQKILQQLHPNDHAFRWQDQVTGGAIVTIEIPFHTSGREQAEGRSFATDENTSPDRRRRALGEKADRYASQVRSGN